MSFSKQNQTRQRERESQNNGKLKKLRSKSSKVRILEEQEKIKSKISEDIHSAKATMSDEDTGKLEKAAGEIKDSKWKIIIPVTDGTSQNCRQKVQPLRLLVWMKVKVEDLMKDWLM